MAVNTTSNDTDSRMDIPNRMVTTTSDGTITGQSVGDSGINYLIPMEDGASLISFMIAKTGLDFQRISMQIL